jgi:predicted PurR-regulated permease PerM
MDSGNRQSRLVTLTASVVAIAALYLAKAVLIPFALALLTSFLLAPVVRRLQRWHFKRTLAVLATMSLLALLAGTLGWLVWGQAQDLSEKIPEYRQNIQRKVAAMREAIEEPFAKAAATVEALGSGVETPPPPPSGKPEPQEVRVVPAEHSPAAALADVAAPILRASTAAAMILLFAFVMLLRREDLRDRFIRLVGDGHLYVTTQALNEASEKLSAYLARQLLLNGLQGAVVGLALMLIGVPNALLWGLLSALLRYVPYVGAWIAAAFPILVSFATSNDWTQPLLVVGVIGLIELVSNNVLEPWVYGAATGISSMAVLLTTMFWTWLWGPIGLVLATPLTVCFVVLGKYAPRLHFLYLLLSDEPVLPLPARLYQRLLSGDQDECWALVRAELKEKPLHEVYDSLVLPALSMAEADRRHTALDAKTESSINETLELILDEAKDLGPAPPSADESATLLAETELRMICIPARDSADELAARMLRQVLAREGLEVEITPLAELVGETLDRLATAPADVVCVSSVPPTRLMHVRYACKRLRSRFPDLEIILGLWTHQLAPEDLADLNPTKDRIQIASSLAEARTIVRGLASSELSRRQTSPEPPETGRAAPAETHEPAAR